MDKFCIHEISICETRQLLSRLKNTKLAGLDEIDASIIKLTPDILLAPINHIINLSIRNCRFPNKWKLARIIPLYKSKGDELMAANYRPVAQLSATSKLLKMVVADQLNDYLTRTKQMNPNHHAYKVGLSTTTAMLQLSDMCHSAINEGQQVGMKMIDMSAAFDCVDFYILKQKLTMYNTDSKTIDWFDSYLSHRSQLVSIAGQDGDYLPVMVGLPQGSILAPTLYNLYVQELPEVMNDDENCKEEEHKVINESLFSHQCMKCGTYICYADDSTYCTKSNNVTELQEKIENSLTKISAFLTSNLLKINEEKTQLMRVMTKKRRQMDGGVGLKLEVEDSNGLKVIEEVRSARLLGCNVSQDMEWKNHLLDGEKAVLGVLRKKLGALKMISANISFKGRLNLANGMIMSKMIYSIQLWGGTSDFLLNKLQVLQNDAARAITRCGRRTHIEVILEKCNWLSVRQLILYHSLISLWKVVYTVKPEYFYDLLLGATSNVHYTRNNSECILNVRSRPNLTLTMNSWRWRAVSDWNNLPHFIKKIKTLNLFKSNLKNFLIETTKRR